MTALAWALIFGVGYPLVSIGVWCIGTFALAANRFEFERRAKAKNDRRWPGTRLESSQVGAELAWPITATILGGIFWPVAIPMWFAWKKGDFIAQALEVRGEKNEATLRGAS